MGTGCGQLDFPQAIPSTQALDILQETRDGQSTNPHVHNSSVRMGWPHESKGGAFTRANRARKGRVYFEKISLTLLTPPAACRKMGPLTRLRNQRPGRKTVARQRAILGAGWWNGEAAKRRICGPATRELSPGERQ